MGVFHVFKIVQTSGTKLRKASYIEKLLEKRLDSVFLVVETGRSIQNEPSQICGRHPFKKFQMKWPV